MTLLFATLIVNEQHVSGDMCTSTYNYVSGYMLLVRDTCFRATYPGVNVALCLHHIASMSIATFTLLHLQSAPRRKTHELVVAPMKCHLSLVCLPSPRHYPFNVSSGNYFRPSTFLLYTSSETAVQCEFNPKSTQSSQPNCLSSSVP